MKGREIEGTILKGYSGFYYVFAQGEVYTCSLRGKYRLKEHNRVFLPGDQVLISILPNGQGVIEAVNSRRTELLRPPVANVDQALLIFALLSPLPDFLLLDRLLVMALHAEIKPVIVWTKADLAAPAVVAVAQAGYEKTGFEQVVVSAVTGQGVGRIAGLLRGWITVLAGPSGAGKSTLLNVVFPGLALKTGTLNPKIGRGRHTTRHVELLAAGGGALVADTPGFSNLFLPPIAPAQLANYFPELAPFLGRCRFKSCRHDAEPDCRVKAAMAAGLIPEQRYKHYVLFLRELVARENRPGPKGRKGND
ncbi:MAG: ribosome small subunit-dependent GTPase A [Heliobacteriaceae bacterium]|nr:ribosome small subunit-dependent GTPase A [Heliobacteriaceae bacterium]